MYFAFHTPFLNEFLDGQKKIIEKGFNYSKRKEPGKSDSFFFQKRNLRIETKTGFDEDMMLYTFLVQKKEMPAPSSIRYAEDLLKFNSHEYLVSFFGEKNVKKDLYFFSEKELKSCSVLFGNSSRQAVFVWDDEDNHCDLAYILVSNVIPTVSAKKFDGVLKNNEWEMKNGVYSGMSIKELLKLNEKDFEIYGSQSKLSFMIKPESSGKIDFKKASIVLSCNNCNDDKLFNNLAVKAQAVKEENLPMYVYHIILYK